MADYTSAEIETAVGKLVRTSIRKPIDSLGVRGTTTTFNDIQEAAAGVFLLYFNAPFYVSKLGAIRTLELVEDQAALVASLIDLVQQTDKIARPIESLTPLSNARSALFELEGALSERDDEFADFSTVPAFRRYASNIDSFIDAHKSNIVASGAVVPTPQQARDDLPALLSSFKTAHDELVRVVTNLENASDDFELLNLPQLIAQSAISNSRGVLEDRIAELDKLTGIERLSKLRELNLDLLTQRAVVEKFGGATKPTQFITTTGTATAFSDATHLATSAELDSTIAGPYDLVSPDFSVEFTMNGGTPFTFALGGSFVAEIRGALQEPFDLSVGNDSLSITVPEGTITTSLPSGAAETASAVAAAVNVDLAALPSITRLKQDFTTVKEQSLFDITSLGGDDARFTLIAPPAGLAGLGIEVGDLVEVTEGLNAGTFWSITVLDAGNQFVDTTAFDPVAPVSAEVAQRCRIGPALRILKLTDEDDQATSVANQRRIDIAGGTTFTPTISDLGARTLGFTPGTFARSRPTLAKDVRDNVNFSLSQVQADIVEFPNNDFPSGTARSTLADPSTVVLYRFRATGATITSGATVTVTVAGAATAGVLAGDTLVLRSVLDVTDIDKFGTVTAASDTSITVDFTGTPVTSADTNAEIEVGPTSTHIFGTVLEILDGPNDQEYVVQDPAGATDIPFELLLDKVLPVPKLGDQPSFFNVELRGEGVQFQSADVTVSSAITISAGSPADLFFTTLPATARGTTPFLLLSSFPSGLTLGDFLDLFEVQYNIASRTFTISGLEESVSVLELDTEIENDFSISFGPITTVPSALIRIGQVASSDLFESQLAAWLAQPESQDAFFINLNRLINPLLVNQNPTAADVGAAESALQDYLDLLSGALVPTTLEFALETFEVEPVEPVDTLITSFLERGADRAIDILLEGRFINFFGLNIHETSHSGNLQESVRNLTREDLPIRKFNRDIGQFGETLLAETEDGDDFEFDFRDADIEPIPDPPLGVDSPSPGENF